MSQRGKFLTSLLLFNGAVLTAAWGIFERRGSYSWGSKVEWFFISRDWEPIGVVLCVSCLLTVGIYLILDCFGKLPPSNVDGLQTDTTTDAGDGK
jgi:hypothetical protein